MHYFMPYYDILHKWRDEHNAGYGIPCSAVTCHFEARWLVQDLMAAEILCTEQRFF